MPREAQGAHAGGKGPDLEDLTKMEVSYNLDPSRAGWLVENPSTNG